MSYQTIPPGRRLGFQVADDDVYSGVALFGNAANTVPTPMQVFNAYHNTPPYPASFYWSTGLYSSGPLSVPPAQEAQWLNDYLTILDGYPNIRGAMKAFVNLSGFSVVGGVNAPPASSGYVDPGFGQTGGPAFKLAHAPAGETTFTIQGAAGAFPAGLSPSTEYTLQLLDDDLGLIATIGGFTTDGTGAFTGNMGVPQTTDDQANNGGYIVVEGTTLGVQTGWQNDQTQDFTDYMEAIIGHPSMVGVLFEPEYFGQTPAIIAKCQAIVNGAGYYFLANAQATGEMVWDYSTYPYFGGALVTTTIPGIAVQEYGETGSPETPPDPSPIWTSAVVTNILQDSAPAPLTMIDSWNDTDNPLTTAPAYQDSSGTDWYLYMSPAFRAVIASNAYYLANYLNATALQVQPTTIQVKVVPSA